VTNTLGELRIRDLRSVWGHEERDFTPWLALEANMARLSEAIGLDLQLERTEVPVGPYFADILAKDASGAYVVVENQFGKTDHDHLGKLLTYGATLGASAVVWVAEKFTDEHRKALEWLNDHTTEELGLYAVQLEVLQIDESRPALRFNVVSQPTELARDASIARTAGPLSETQQLQLEFWKQFRDCLLQKKILTSTQTPRPQYWFDVPLGRAYISLSNICDTSGRIGVRVYINNKVAASALPQLEVDKAAIESEIGSPLQWNPNPTKRDKIIALFRPVDLQKRDKWPEYCDWLAETVAKFRKTFMPRVKALKLTSNVDDPVTHSTDASA
jgi:Domain of unknown function (DUF4268)